MSQSSNLILPDDYVNNNEVIVTRINKDMDSWNYTCPHYLFTGVCGSGKTWLVDIIFDNIRRELIESLEISQKKERCFDFDNPEKMKGNAIMASYELRIQSKIECITKYTAREMYQHYIANNLQIPDITRIFCLDDVGAEKETPGSRDLIIDVITKLYDKFKLNKNLFVIITTNLTGNQLVERYGNRIVDRIFEMCTVMEFDKHSFRRDKIEVIKREVK